MRFSNAPRKSILHSPPKIIAIVLLLTASGLGWRYLHKSSSGTLATLLPGVPGAASVPAFNGPTEDCDVLVVGGTPSGIAAALAAARRGATVTLIEPRRYLGGDIVYAMLNMFDIPVRPGVPAPVHGIFAEFFEQLGITFDIDKSRHLFEDTLAAEPKIRRYMRTKVVRIIKDNDRVTGVIVSTDTMPLPESKPVGTKPIEATPAASPHSTPDATPTTKPTPISTVANHAHSSTPSSSHTATPVERLIHVKVVVDATNDANFAAQAGAGYYIGRETANPDKKMQAAGLLFSVAGVNWEAVRDYVKTNRLIKAKVLPNGHLFPGDAVPLSPYKEALEKLNPEKVLQGHPASVIKSQFAEQKAITLNQKLDTSKFKTVPAWEHLGGTHGNYAWERGETVKKYQPHGKDIELLSINFGRQTDGTIVLNTLNILNVNGTDQNSIKHGWNEGVHELPYLLAYLRKAVPGFAHARLAKVAPELYIRETRHIHGYYTLKVDDVRSQTRFFDRIAMVSYPLDLHPYEKGKLNPYEPRRYYYTLPLRSLVTRKINGVFVASRSFSATYSAAGSARVIPVTMAAGEAAGAAAFLCVQENITPHDIMRNSKWAKMVQTSLREGGADVGDTYPGQQKPKKITSSKDR
ncbi:MAG: FAD-dependent oxidoreductase [Abitibacteriaceae bacterium]|nr:FAD-dependent oxidoreductase [Abditibacteriaceae bacterium]